jgi:hypothetical protein
LPPTGSQGVDALCRALKANATLRELDVSRVPVDDRGAASIAQVSGLRACCAVLLPCFVPVCLPCVCMQDPAPVTQHASVRRLFPTKRH